MKICPNCGAQVEDGASFCTGCGYSFAGNVPATFDPADHTAEFAPEDIRENKLLAMAVYLLSAVGVIIALLAAPNSAYVRFHVKEALKLMICEVLVGLITAVLAWTVIVAILGGIAVIVLVVVQIICFVRVCKGQAKQAPILDKIDFLN